MKTVEKAAEVKTAYGNPLPTPISFSYNYDELGRGDTIPEDEKPKDMDELVLNYVNAKRNSAARASAQNAALEKAGIEAPAKDDPKVLTRSFLNNLKTAGKNYTEAVEVAKMILSSDQFDEATASNMRW